MTGNLLLTARQHNDWQLIATYFFRQHNDWQLIFLFLFFRGASYLPPGSFTALASIKRPSPSSQRGVWSS